MTTTKESPEPVSKIVDTSQVGTAEKPKIPCKKIILMAIFVLAIFGLAFFIVKGKMPLEKPGPILPLPTETPLPTATLSGQNKLSFSHNEFGFNILKLIQKEEGDKNIFISPSSIALALSMVYNGAEAETKIAMEKALGFQGTSLEEINKGSAELLALLQNPDPKVQLSIANSIWGRKGVSFGEDFLSVNEKYYRAKVTDLDFASPAATDVINSWVRENTNGRIASIVSPPIPPEMVMFLINAVYFKGTWTFEFDKKLTEEKDFIPAVGKKEKVLMMEQKRDNFKYFENKNFQAVSLPYGTNKRLSMYVFLPKGKIAEFGNLLTGASWQEFVQNFKEKEGTLLLPKFKLEYEKSLIGTLSDLGMGIAFSDKADFSKIAPNLFISEIKHKTFVEVNEEGTEAAGVTSIGLGITSIGGEEKTFYMEVNRPFFLAITDTTTGEILFMGLINLPKM